MTVGVNTEGAFPTYIGSGPPEAVQNGPAGAVYVDESATPNTQYWKSTPSGNTGWKQLGVDYGGPVPALFRFPFSFDTPGLADGVPAFDPAVGAYMINWWIEVDTPWDGTTPYGDIGIAGNAGILYSTSGTIQSMSIPYMDDTGLRLINPGSINSVIYGVAPVKFLSDDPLSVWVNTTGASGDLPAFAFAGEAPTLPLTIVEGTNDEFTYTPEGGGAETFTVAPGTLTNLTECAAALSAATGTDSDTFSDYATVTTGVGIIMTSTTPGSAENGAAIGDGVNDCATDFQIETLVFAGGLDAGSDPGATQGEAVLNMLVVMPS